MCSLKLIADTDYSTGSSYKRRANIFNNKSDTDAITAAAGQSSHSNEHFNEIRKEADWTIFTFVWTVKFMCASTQPLQCQLNLQAKNK